MQNNLSLKPFVNVFSTFYFVITFITDVIVGHVIICLYLRILHQLCNRKGFSVTAYSVCFFFCLLFQLCR